MVFLMDDSCFIYKEMNLIITFYVDDIQYLGEKLEDVTWIEKSLAETFNMINTGPTKFYLGSVINYDQLAKKIHISQARYVKQIIRDFDYLNAKPVHTPMRVDHKLIKEEKSTVTKFQIQWYSSRVGSLNFLAVITRPDISHATGVLLQFLTNPNESHCEAVDRVYAYLNTYPELGLIYGLDNTDLINYINADWAGD